MKNKIHVLVFPAGEINSIELHDALSTNVNIKLFGASSIERHGSYVFQNYISDVPLITDNKFIDEFNKILVNNDIDFIFPTHDTVAQFLTENSEKIKAKTIASDKETARICRDKKLIYEVFENYKFIPKTYTIIEKYPVFIKPRKGQGGVGAFLVKSENDLPKNIDLNDYVINEYLPGEEYTVDCLTDKKGNLQFVSPRSRKRLLAGVTVSGSNEKITDEINNIALAINSKLKFLGLWWFQIKKDNQDRWKLLEISTRVAGTMCLTRAKGVNLPLLSIYVAKGYDISIISNPYNVKVDRTLISRYEIDYNYDTVYLDFDDTLIINGKVHLPTIQFVYQCKNKNIKVILITRHEYNIENTLKKHAIAKDLFQRIVHLKENEDKIDYINPKNAIFVDNAYQERITVYHKYKIPVFDVDGIEVLLDWRK